MTQAVLLLRCLSIAVQASCLVALATRRLARRYPVFWGFTFLAVLHAVWAPGAWNAWALAAMYAALAIEACLTQARHFRSLFSFAIGSIVVFAVLSAALGAIVCLFGADILRGGGPAMLMCSACCMLLVLSTAFFASFPVTLRPNVRWHVAILQVLLAGAAVSAALASLSSPGARLAAQLVATVCPLVCYALWTVKLVPSGECFLPLSDIPAELLARLMAREPATPAPPPPPARHAPPRNPPTLRWKPDHGS
jgi:hypothetical protein